MTVLAWAERRSRALSLWDIGFLKVSAMLFGMIVGAYVSSFVIRNVWWFVVPMLLLGGWSGYHWFTSEAPEAGGA